MIVKKTEEHTYYTIIEKNYITLSNIIDPIAKPNDERSLKNQAKFH